MEKSASFISRIFNLRPGDFARGLPLFAYYLLIVTFGYGWVQRDESESLSFQSHNGCHGLYAIP